MDILPRFGHNVDPKHAGQTQTSGTFLNTEDAYDGFTLLDPMGSTSTYLINNCGEVVNSWSSDHRSAEPVTCWTTAAWLVDAE